MTSFTRRPAMEALGRVAEPEARILGRTNPTQRTREPGFAELASTRHAVFSGLALYQQEKSALVQTRESSGRDVPHEGRSRRRTQRCPQSEHRRVGREPRQAATSGRRRAPGLGRPGAPAQEYSRGSHPTRRCNPTRGFHWPIGQSAAYSRAKRRRTYLARVVLTVSGGARVGRAGSGSFARSLSCLSRRHRLQRRLVPQRL